MIPKIIKLVIIIIAMSELMNTVFAYNDTDSDNAYNETDKHALYTICWMDRPDAVVVSDSGHIYLFKLKWFWKLKFNSKSMKIKVIESGLITNSWNHSLPNDIDLGFTIGKTYSTNSIAGHTIFVKRGKYYLYRNESFANVTGNVTHWNNFNAQDVDYMAPVITDLNSSLVLMANIILPMRIFAAYNFDEASYPEFYAPVNLAKHLLYNLKLHRLIYLIPLTYSGHYLAIYRYHNYANFGHYCVMKNIRSKCNEMEIYSLFNCSSVAVLRKSWLNWLFNESGLNAHQLLVILCGASFAVLCINIMNIAIITIRTITLY